jgi:hypothetical protein
LADTGADGVEALHIAKQHHQQQLYDAYVLTEGKALPGVDRVPDTHVPETLAQSRALNELKNVEQRAALFEGVPYYVFRTLSDQVHAGLGTSRVYAPVDSEGTGQLLKQPASYELHGWPDSALADCAIRCVQALLVLAAEVQDSVLQEAALAWCEGLGLDPDLPERAGITRKSYRWHEVKQAAADAQSAIDEAKPLVAQLEDEMQGVDATLAYRALRSLKSACFGLIKVVQRG